MQPIVFTDTDYWEPFAKNVRNQWVGEIKPQLMISAKTNIYAVGAASRLGCRLVKYDGDKYECGSKKLILGPSYKEIRPNPVPMINSPVLSIDPPNDLMGSALGLAQKNGYSVLTLGEKPWGTFFYGGDYDKSRLYDIIINCYAVISSDRHLLMNCWGLGIPATNIATPSDILPFLNDKKVSKVVTRQESFEEILQFSQLK